MQAHSAPPKDPTEPSDPAHGTTVASEKTKHPGFGRKGLGLGSLVTLAVLSLAAGGYWFSQRVDRVETSAARRLQGTDQRLLQLETQTKLYQDEIRELESRASVLESKLVESIGQQVQLEQLYKSMAVDSADGLLYELERSVLAGLGDCANRAF